jgi:hypothetical protein
MLCELVLNNSKELEYVWTFMCCSVPLPFKFGMHLYEIFACFLEIHFVYRIFSRPCGFQLSSRGKGDYFLGFSQ